jgi:hypothetical protein
MPAPLVHLLSLSITGEAGISRQTNPQENQRNKNAWLFGGVGREGRQKETLKSRKPKSLRGKGEYARIRKMRPSGELRYAGGSVLALRQSWASPAMRRPVLPCGRRRGQVRGGRRGVQW